MSGRGRGNVKVYIDGDSSGLGRATKQAETHLGRLGSGVSRAGDKMAAAGSTLSRGVTLPVLAIGAVAGKTAVDFDKSMRNVNSIAQLPEPRLKALEKSVLGLAGPTAQAPRTLAEGLYDLVSSGFDAKESLGILEKSARAATAGLTTTEISTAAVAAVLNAYHLKAGQAGRTSDQLFETVNRGVISFEDLAQNVGDVLPFASSLHVGLGQVGASIATMTKQGISAPETMTRIKNVMVTLLKPGEALKEVLDELGISGEDLVRKKGFQGALETLIAQTDGSKEAVSALFPNIRALGGVLALTGDNARSAAGDLTAFKDTAGATGTALSEQEKSTVFKWSEFKAELESTAVEVAPEFLDAGKEIVGTLDDIAGAFDELSPATKSTIIHAGLLAAALGPVLTIGGNLLKVFGGTLGLADKMAGAYRTIGTGAVAAQTATAGVAPMPSRRAPAVPTSTMTPYGPMASVAPSSRAINVGQSGVNAAKGFAGAFAKSLGPAIALAGVGNIVYSAASGDMEKAGIKAGGALVGGIAGAVLGKSPAAAALGAGLGTFAADALAGLFESGKQLTPLQARLRAESEHAARAFDAQGDAARGLMRAEQQLTQSNQRHRDSTRGVKDAHRELNETVRRFGPASQQAYAAELRLARAQRQDAESAREAKQAHKLAGNELRLYQHRTVEAVAAEKQRIPGIARMVAHLRKKYSEEHNNVRLLDRLVDKERELSGSRRHLNSLFEQAATKSSPQFARGLERMTTAQAQFGKRFNTLVKQLPELGREVKHTADIGGNAWIDFRGTVHTQTTRATGDVKSFAAGTTGGFKEVESSLASALTALGVKQVNFTTGAKGKAEGGMVRVPGQGREDTVALSSQAIAAMVAPGEDLIVANRHQRPELDYAVWSTYGDRGMDGFFQRSKRPHNYAKGGIAHPALTGTDPMQDMGQHSIDRVYKASRKYLSKIGGEKSLRALVKEGNRMDALRQPYLWGGGHGAMPSKGGPWDCSGGISQLFYGAGWKDLRPMVSSGFESFGLPGSGSAAIYANAEHVYAVLGGRAIGTSGDNPGGGFGWISSYTSRPGFVVRHVDLAGEGMPTRRRTGRGQKQRKGFAKGGIVDWGSLVGSSWDKDEMATLAHVVGAPSPGLMGAIGWAESQGDDDAENHNTNGTVDEGLWQINSVHGYSDMKDPLANAEAMKEIVGSQGLGAWVTYNEGLVGGKGSVDSALASKIRDAVSGKEIDPDRVPVHGRHKLSYEEKSARLDTRIAKAETTSSLKDDRRGAVAKLDLMRGRKAYLEKQVRGINKKLKGKLKPPVRDRLLSQRESFLSELSGIPGEASGLIESLRESGVGDKGLRRHAKGFGIGVADPNAEKVTARDHADLRLARAERTPDQQDDLSALQKLVSVSEQELKAAQKSRNPKRIAEAVRNLKEANDAVVELRKAIEESMPTAQDYANRDLALAELTESTDDDRAALQKLKELAEQQLSAALATSDPRDDIEAAQNLKSVTEALKSLEDTISEAEQQRRQFDEERLALDKKMVALAETQGPTVLAALAAWVDGAIGGPVASRQRLATAGVSAGYQ